MLIEIVEDGGYLAVGDGAVVVMDVVKQVHDVAVVLLFVACHHKAELLLGTRDSHIQNVGIIGKWSNLVIYHTHDDGILFPTLELVYGGGIQFR